MLMLIAEHQTVKHNHLNNDRWNSKCPTTSYFVSVTMLYHALFIVSLLNLELCFESHNPAKLCYGHVFAYYSSEQAKEY